MTQSSERALAPYQPQLDFEPAAKRDLRREADEWIAKYPHVYRLFERYALEASRRGRKFGMKALVERVRWQVIFETDEEYKLNNNYTSYIGRRLVRDHPELEQYIEFRKVNY